MRIDTQSLSYSRAGACFASTVLLLSKATANKIFPDLDINVPKSKKFLEQIVVLFDQLIQFKCK